MRTGTLFALSGAALLALVSVSHAAPLAASAANNAAIETAMAGEGVTAVHYRKRYRHYSYRHHRHYRGHHYGWRHRPYRPAYGYAPYYGRRHSSGVTIHFR